MLRSALVHRTLVMLSFLGVLAAAPARADAPADRPHDWSLSTRASAEADHWSRLRVYGVEAADDTLHVSFSSLDVRHRLDWHGKPALSSPRALWRRPYTRVSGGVSARMLGLATSSWTADIFGLGFEAGQVRQHDGPLAAVQN